MLPKLDDLLSYENERVLGRYRKDHATNRLSAELAFEQVLKYLWLAEKHRQDKAANPTDQSLDFQCGVHHEMAEIDDMWHTFLLFTRDYHDFSNRYFGHYLHHEPNSHENPPSPEKFEKEFTRYLSYVYDNLGEETVKLWFSDLLSDEGK